MSDLSSAMASKIVCSDALMVETIEVFFASLPRSIALCTTLLYCFVGSSSSADSIDSSCWDCVLNESLCKDCVGV